MVGYRAGDTLTPNQKLIAGCISGVVTRFLTQPLDVLKVRTQLQHKTAMANQKTVFDTAKKILKEEGVSAFWHGHHLGQVQSVVSIGSQFYIYELTTKFVYNASIDHKYKKILIFLCGVFAGCFGTTLALPLEVIRIRQMIVKDQYKGLWSGAREVYNSGGVLAFYGGWTTSLLQMGPAVGIQFAVFSTLQPQLMHYLHECRGECKHARGNAHNPELLLVASTISGSVAGFVSKTMTYPLDLAKRRLQIGSHKENRKYRTPSTSMNLVKCKKLYECIGNMIRSEGMMGLYRGWRVSMYKTQVTSILAFTSYELACYFIRESLPR